MRSRRAGLDRGGLGLPVVLGNAVGTPGNEAAPLPASDTLDDSTFTNPVVAAQPAPEPML